MVIFLGNTSSDKIPFESVTTGKSFPSNCNLFGIEPVAIMMFLASIIPPLTSTFPGDFISADPSINSTPSFSKDLRINGSILCNGTFSAGRNQPSGSGNGLIYDYNSRIYLSLNQTNTYISGSGYFHPRTVNIVGDSGETNLIVDIYNMVLDENFVAKSNNRVKISIERYSYVNVKKVLGLTGSTYQYSSSTAKADLSIKGVLLILDLGIRK